VIAPGSGAPRTLLLMIAVVPVRDGVLPSGADETIAECGGRVVVAGGGTESVDLTGLAIEATLVELGAFCAGSWGAALAPMIAAMDDHEIVVLPGSSDGRDLAPRLAAALRRPLFAGATEVGPEHVRVARRGGRDLVEYPLLGPVVATLQPGVRGTTPFDATVQVYVATPAPSAGANDAVVVEVQPPDVTTMDLTEAGRIIGGGAGLDDARRFGQLEQVAAALAATVGATRVVTDRSWVPHERQIGTTGVVVDPELYIAFGISGAVQHTSGLGAPDHIVSVNTDAHCPMMQMSDLAIVSDANAVLDELITMLDDGSNAGG
jgi:electron transfer flavoprotein alpha subunit